MIRFVNAKINLGLRVLRKRPDGYHDLSTVFYPVGRYAGTPQDPGRLADTLEITPSDTDSLQVYGDTVDCPTEKNLVWKALQLFRSELSGSDCPPVQISLDKHLPSQAGLGGGSADASFTLLMLNELVGEPYNEEELLKMALQLGADCPFFILNRPCIANGVGERLTPIDLDLSGMWALILKPDEGISTREAFANITPGVPNISVEEVIRRPITEWKELLVNDFETSMFAIHTDLRAIKEYLYSTGALYASMSGSGSAFYGLYPTESAALAALGTAPTPYVTVARL